MWLGYLILLNASAFFIMLADKRKAIKKKWRIPESNLMTLALLGGSPGILAGMYAFRHKTRHLKFTLGVPLIFVLQLMALVFFWYWKQ